MKLREWQAEAIPLALGSIEAGRSEITVATTGAGKSVYLAEIIRRHLDAHPGAHVVVTTPSVKLVEQLGATIGDIVGAHRVGRYYTRAKQWERQITVACNASVPALAARLDGRRKVDLWIADEVHKAETDSVRGAADDVDVCGLLKAARRHGLTATPFRANERETLTLWTGVCYSYPPARALRDGVIVPARYVMPEVDLDDADAWTIAQIVALGPDRGPGAVDASSIADAEWFVARLAQHGIRAAALHSKLPTGAGDRILKRLKAGELDCVVHVAMLVEGVDMPWLRWLAVRRETGSRIRWIQQLGRVVRCAPGKVEAVVIDPLGQSMEYSPTYSAALGWPDPEEEARVVRELVAREREAMTGARTEEARRAAAVSCVARYVRAVWSAWCSEGFPQGRKRPVVGRRSDPLSRSMRLRMQNAAPELDALPVHGPTLARIARKPALLCVGSALDVESLTWEWLKRPEWVPAMPIPFPPEEALSLVAREDVVYVGSAMNRDLVAVYACTASRREIVRDVRRRVVGDNPVRLVSAGVDRVQAQGMTARVSDERVAQARGVQFCEARDNPAQGAAWALLNFVTKVAPPKPEPEPIPLPDAPPPTDADAPGWAGRWSAR